jgi:PAS domain S-box-containing protein
MMSSRVRVRLAQMTPNCAQRRAVPRHRRLHRQLGSLVGLDGNPRWINHAVRDYTGYSVQECLEMKDFIGTIVHPDDERRIRAELARCMDGQKREDVEFRCVRKDGSVFWLACPRRRLPIRMAPSRVSAPAAATSPTASRSKPNCAFRPWPSTRARACSSPTPTARSCV